MVFDKETVEEPTRKEQLRSLQAQVDEILVEAISNKWTLIDFAITIWVKTVRQEAPYSVFQVYRVQYQQLVNQFLKCLVFTPSSAVASQTSTILY